MDEKLWAGVGIKLENALYHLDMMGRSLQPPERTAINVARQASGAIIDTGWQRSFYAHLDAFLSVARSVPEIIQCCFGVDIVNDDMKDWFNELIADERDRRNEFKKQFGPHHDAFRVLRLSKVRNISLHRTGVAPVTVTISGLFGVTYVGGPAERVPISETRQIDHPTPPLWPMSIPIHPKWDDFDIEGQPLFPACRAYLNGAQALVHEARRIVLLVHDTNSLSFPPT